nr:reverse transcriptase domain-containing protein [Tanacetum cinerariifolium]
MLPKDIYTLINHYTDAKDIWDNVKMLLEAVKLNRGLRDSNYDQLYAYLKQHEAHANENKIMLDRFTQHTVDPLALMSKVSHQQHYSQSSSTSPSTYVPPHLADNAHLNIDNYDAFDSDVDEAPTAQTMFMANLSSTNPVYDEAGPSYDSDILSEVHDHDHYQDAICEHHDEHEVHDNVLLNYVVDSHADYTSDSNMIMYDQYVKGNAVPGVHSNVSSILNDAYMMIYNDMYELHAQSVSKTSWNTSVDNSLTAELETYREQVELYERRAMFELTEREQKINKQLRIVISDRNFKEETLKKELHSIKLQLASTINHYKLMVEEVMSLKEDFKQKETKYIEYFLDMKSFKEKVEDRLFKQDQSLQTVYMLCRPKPYYNELNKKLRLPKTLLIGNMMRLNKKLLIANDNLIDECLSKEVFHVATNSELNVARFTEMHVANTIVEARCLELVAELFNLRDKSHNKNHNEFLSKSAEKSLPLFQTLKKCIKKSDFRWTTEAKQAFQQLKQHLSAIPLLAAPRPQEELIMYLSATHGAISAVLLTERGTVQTSVYFISRALQGPELNYSPMKKLVLSLVFAAKRLRRYFQAHPIAVNGNIFKTQTNATPSRLSSPRTSSEGGLGCHVTMEGSPVQARPKRLSNLPNEPPLGEATVDELKSTKAFYNKAFITLTKSVRKLEKKLKH